MRDRSMLTSGSPCGPCRHHGAAGALSAPYVAFV